MTEIIKRKPDGKQIIDTKQNLRKSIGLYDWPKDAQKSGIRWPTHKRHQYIKHLITNIGELNINKGALAREMGIQHSMLHEDFKRVHREGLTPEDLEMMRSAVLMGSMKAVAVAQSAVLESKDAKEKSSVSRDFMEVLDKATTLQERWEVKKPSLIEQASSIRIVWGDPDEEKEEDANGNKANATNTKDPNSD